jgi:hypothetical protein
MFDSCGLRLAFDDHHHRLLAVPADRHDYEQQRIVAKVDRLMKLCDDLEAKLRRAEDRASRLVEAVVQKLVT